jgi:hypothetical protein
MGESRQLHRIEPFPVNRSAASAGLRLLAGQVGDFSNRQRGAGTISGSAGAVFNRPEGMKQ